MEEKNFAHSEDKTKDNERAKFFEGDLVLCTVKEVTPTGTFVELESGQKGTIISSEIAPGRIKFMRQYVVPNKKIVCKVLGFSGDNIHLSLRRVNSKEKKEVMDKFEQERSINSAFKQLFGKEEDQIREKILKKFSSIIEFTEEARKDSSLIEKYIPEEGKEAIKRLLEKRKKNLELKQKINIKCLEEDGVKRIKKIFDLNDESVSVIYIAAGEFKLKLKVDDFKQGKQKMQKIIEELEKRAKSNKCEFQAFEEK